MLIKRKSIEQVESSRPASKPTPVRKPKYAPVTLSEQDGVRYLHFGTEWVQGAMRIRKPNWPELEYAQQMMAWMLWQQQPARIAQLGLGTATLTKYCYVTFPEAAVTAVELNPSVIAICASMFKLPDNDARLNVVEMDALDYVNDEANAGTLDVLQVDLYDATARGPVLDSAEFYQSCNACLTDDGIMTVNLFGDHPSYARNIKAIKFAFEQVICLPQVHDGNVVAIAFKRQRAIDLAALAERAAQITASTKLPAKTWVKGIAAK
ncbi:spermine/spermidine synthase domain-containing protein [Rugamonas aquatica]|uniref:Spermidine synthase n=1 Tax=Rugamonas aquatica TaxID=2743357 RepID=A0A6A7N4X1_9BURK|nr:spermidine synthase [Rugamonas aquatica]MQA40115.1 spermidine synthase [Rugamonas aquatica]